MAWYYGLDKKNKICIMNIPNGTKIKNNVMSLDYIVNNDYYNCIHGPFESKQIAEIRSKLHGKPVEK